MLRKGLALGLTLGLLVCAAVGLAAYEGEWVEMAELGCSFRLPLGWTEDTSLPYRAFYSPEGDRELAFWLLEDEMSLETIYACAVEAHQEDERAFRNIEKLCLGELDCLFYVDEANQFCAHLPRDGQRALYVSLSDNGTGSGLFRSILQSIAPLGVELTEEPTAVPALVRATPAPSLRREATPTPAPTAEPTARPTEKPTAKPTIGPSRCGVCNGTGRCYPCMGRGWRYAHGDRVECAACKGSGKCRTCGGDGVK